MKRTRRERPGKEPAAPSPRRRGRPPHLDDPPAKLATTIPGSLNLRLRSLAARTGRPVSEHLAKALVSYLKRHE